MNLDKLPEYVRDLIIVNGLTVDEFEPVWEMINNIDVNTFIRSVEDPIVLSPYALNSYCCSPKVLKDFNRKVCDTYMLDSEWKLKLFYWYVMKDTRRYIPRDVSWKRKRKRNE